MSLTPITRNRRVRRFSVYDFEWVPGSLDIRIAGCYDGRRYECYRTVRDFLDYQLVSRNSGRWFYAHAGGLADVQFVFEEILQSGRYTIDATFSGSSAIIVHIRRGKNVWHFVDSYWLFRDKLSSIAKSIGEEKTGPEKELTTREEVKEWYATVDLKTLTEYNKNDCVVLWQAIYNFQLVLLELGGELQQTIASTAMHLFRRKYLAHEIATSDSVNRIARGAYFASRVEVFNTECQGGYYYDINSSFPYAMTQVVPGPLVRTRDVLEDRLLEYGIPFLADVEIEIPERYFPTTPTRINGRLFFPFGSWRTWLSGVDIELLLQEGGHILKVYEVMEFEKYLGLSEYANDLYERRAATDDTFTRIVYKYLLNSLYGKFGEREHKRRVHINPGLDTIMRLDINDLLMPGVWSETVLAKIHHMHVPIAVYITSIARKVLYDYMSHAAHFHYCDTDGFSTDTVFSTGDGLGNLKLEKIINEAMFYGPKIYKIKGQVLGKKGWEPKTLVKAKGFSLGDNASEAETKFNQLVSGAELEIERMIRIRENAAKGIIRPKEIKVIKGLRHSLIPKRSMYPDGNSRPWHYDELLSQK